MGRKENLQAQLNSLAAQIAKLESMPEDDFAAGEVVYFTKSYPADTLAGIRRDTTYSYAAVKTEGGLWYTTGTKSTTKTMDWESLVEFADEGSIFWATSWKSVE